MKLVVRLLVTLVCTSCLAGLPASAQKRYDEGHVERVVLMHATPGHANALLDSMKKDAIPVWDAEKKAGIIVDYQLFINQTSAGPEDWDIGYSIVYTNMAALDGLFEKVDPITKAHYGDYAKRDEAAQKRVENFHVVSSMLIRDITLR